jgi:predicted nucleic-acid-binding protein
MKRLPTLPDTNFLLRYLLRDIEEQYRETEDFFEQVRSGTTRATVSESVLVECLYILTKHYKVPRPDTATALTPLFQYKGIINSDKATLVKALALFAETNLDPVDCVLAAQAIQGGHAVMTFDKALRRICAKGKS